MVVPDELSKGVSSSFFEDQLVSAFSQLLNRVDCKFKLEWKQEAATQFIVIVQARCQSMQPIDQRAERHDKG